MQTLDIERLPENARHELIDFYEFLLSKYVRSEVRVTSSEPLKFKVPREVAPFEPLSREACYER